MATGRTTDLSEVRFQWLLQQRSFQYVPDCRLEERIDIRDGKRPDFFAWKDGVELLVEVKSFKSRKLRPGFFYDSPARRTKPIRKQIGHACETLRPYASLGKPMMIVLDNHRRAGIDLSARDLVDLFGELHLVVPIGGDDDSDMRYAHGLNQMFREGHKQYISAIAVQTPKSAYADQEPVEVERPMRVKVLHNPLAHVALPRSLFDDAEDLHAFHTGDGWLIPGQWY